MITHRTDNALGEQMHIDPGDARAHGSNNGLAGVQHGGVHNLLPLREPPVGGERACDVGSVARVLGTHVEETAVSTAARRLPAFTTHLLSYLTYQKSPSLMMCELGAPAWP
jgi:hypothetical protein